MLDDVHTGIRSADKILTAEEAFSYHITNGEDATPDFTSADMTEALQIGKVTVYSSYPIENGVFVSASKMEGQNYAGEGKLYSKKVPVANVAWIDGMQGQYAELATKETAKAEVIEKIDNIFASVSDLVPENKQLWAKTSISKIASSLSRSRQWVYKWISRYENNPSLIGTRMIQQHPRGN